MRCQTFAYLTADSAISMYILINLPVYRLIDGRRAGIRDHAEGNRRRAEVDFLLQLLLLTDSYLARGFGALILSANPIVAGVKRKRELRSRFARDNLATAVAA